MIHFEKNGINTIFELDGKPVLTVKGKEGYSDTFEEIEDGIFRWTRSGGAAAHMDLTIAVQYRADFYMVPGVNYNGNGFGTFCEYLGDRYQGIPWVYSWSRAAVPAMTMSQGFVGEREVACSLFGEANDNASCSICLEGRETVQKIIWPEEESPKQLNLYRYDEPYYGKERLRDTYKCYLVIEDKPAHKAGYRKAIEFAFRLGKPDRIIRKPFSMEQIWEYGIAYANTLYTEEEDGFRGFYIGLYWDGSEWRKNSTIKYEIGWGGQNALLATSLIYYSMVHPEDVQSRNRGFGVLDSWIEYCSLPIGIIHGCYDPATHRYIEACNLGAAGDEFFYASKLALELGDKKRSENYCKAAMDICNFALREQGARGEFAKCWNEDGTAAVLEGTAGAFLAIPLTKAYEVTGEEKYLISAKKALRYYMQELQNYGFSTAGALDIFSIDKESSIPLLKTALRLYKITKEQEWLDDAVMAAWYLSTWQYCATEKFEAGTTMGETGYDTYGGTLVSTVHQGMDSFANSYVPELYELYRITGEKMWYERAKAIWENGCQHLSDGTTVINGVVRPKGSQDEYYETTRQSLTGNPQPGSASGWLVAWPGAFRLEVIRKLRNIPEAEDFFR